MNKGDEQEVKQLVADELRRVADSLESDELELTSPVRYTRQAIDGEELPADVQITYYVQGVGDRSIEVWV